MEFIGFFLPAAVSIMVRNRNREEADWHMPNVIFRYGIYVLINVLLTVCVITYGLGVSGVTSDALNSFPFFIKYTIIAFVMAVLVPFAEEIIRKNIMVTLTVRAYDEKKKDCMDDCQ